MSEAAIIKSPSFSRERSSRTTINSPFSRKTLVGDFLDMYEGEEGLEQMVRKPIKLTECGDGVFYRVKFLVYI